MVEAVDTCQPSLMHGVSPFKSRMLKVSKRGRVEDSSRPI
jgi:hypothetical protein